MKNRYKNKGKVSDKKLKRLSVVLPVLICAALFGGEAVFPSDQAADGDYYEQVLQLEQAGEKYDIDVYDSADTEEAYTEINGNKPFFTDDEYTTEAFEYYSELDEYGRCGMAYANICEELMPSEERGSIGMIKPTGWHTVRYDDLVEGKYLYNRCHLIAFSLAGENANEQNLITGTRYMNTEGMLPFEMKVLNYVRETGNHVLYRVTPIFEEKNLLASGVLMEAYSVEDSGEGVEFCVYVYNVQPGIKIDYATGESHRA